MQLSIKTNFPEIQKLLQAQQKQAVYAAAVALNKSADQAIKEIRDQQRKVFDRPTSWFLNALRLSPRATKQKLEARIWFKDRNSVESSRDMLIPHIEGGVRSYKAMETRLRRLGVLPDGWLTVPGSGAKLDGNGNMSKGEITFILNYLGAYKEAGYNKINDASRARYKKGSKKKQGFQLFVARPANRQGLTPGVYRKTSFGFGSAIKPLLVFVSHATYKRRLDFYGIAQRSVTKTFPAEFAAAYQQAIRTAR